MSKDSLVKGTLILTVAALTARVLGVVQRIPLVVLLGDGGMASYTIAYNIYFALLTVATAGMPSALSKMVSERWTLGKYDEVNRIFRSAVWFALGAGFVMAAVLYAISPYVAAKSDDPEAVLAIRALAPALLLFPLIAILRGYFQGRQTMSANGLSQVVEQILRVITAVALAYLFVTTDWGIAWGAAGASFGGVTGAVGAILVMLWAYKGLRRRDASEVRPAGAAGPRKGGELSFRHIIGQILKLGIPISIISLNVQLIYLIDSTTVIPLLRDIIGYDQAKETLGILGGRAQSLAGLPIILAVAVSQSIVPIISSAYAKGDDLELRRQSSMALRIGMLTGLPFVLFIAIAAMPINGFVFKDTNGSDLIAAMAIASMFQIVMLTSSAILMGLGQLRNQIVHVAIGIAVKLIGNQLLVPSYDIYGIAASTILAYAVTMSLNLFALRRTVRYSILGQRWVGYTSAVAIAAIGGILAQRLSSAFIKTGDGVLVTKLSFALQTAVIGIVIFGLYGLFLAVFKVVTGEDLARLPGPLRRLFARGKRAAGRQG